MKITCPHCGLTGKIPEGASPEGEPLVCPRCGESFEPKRKPAPKKRQPEPELFALDEPGAPSESSPCEPYPIQPTELPPPPVEPAPLSAGPAPPGQREPSGPAAGDCRPPEPGRFSPEEASPRRASVPAGAILLFAALLVAAGVLWHLALALHLGRSAHEFCSDPAHYPPVLGAAGALLFLLAVTAKKRTG